MTTIYKYPLDLIELNEIDMPEQAEILSIQLQNGVPCIWAMVSPDFPKEKRAIRMIGTGHEVNPCEPLQFIDTIQFYPDPWTCIVFHFFEITNHYKKP